MAKPQRRIPLIDRATTDENFSHCLEMLGLCAAWVEGITENQRMGFNDRNMVMIPTEIALAFVKDAASGDGPLAEGARKCFEMLERLRQLNREPTND